ncbi:MAG: hypothetical protein KC592_19520 [Nitrospira sp.]|nr:hypothetical protein [Nitrospira sp.]
MLNSEENCKDPHGFNQRRKNTSHWQRAIGPSTRERGADNLFPKKHGQAYGFRDDQICHRMSIGAIGLGKALLRRVFPRQEHKEPWPNRVDVLARNFPMGEAIEEGLAVGHGFEKCLSGIAPPGHVIQGMSKLKSKRPGHWRSLDEDSVVSEDLTQNPFKGFPSGLVSS